MSDPIRVVYESGDLRSIADLMDDVSKHDENITVTGEAYVMTRRLVHNHNLTGEAAWVTSVEFQVEGCTCL